MLIRMTIYDFYRHLRPKRDIFETGADGSERTQLEIGQESSSGNAGLLLADLVSQPDLRD